jgi:nitrogen regulatory protein P-II 1
MWLLVYILNEDRYLTEVLEELLEIGVTGASIVDSVGMLRFLSQEIPIFAGFRSILKGTKPHNKIILSVIKDKPLLEQALETIDRTVGGIANGNSGILFSLAVDHLISPGTKPPSN